jgi:hypothetical protein
MSKYQKGDVIKFHPVDWKGDKEDCLGIIVEILDTPLYRKWCNEKEDFLPLNFSLQNGPLEVVQPKYGVVCTKRISNSLSNKKESYKPLPFLCTVDEELIERTVKPQYVNRRSI